jgi:hypothetical protein
MRVYIWCDGAAMPNGGPAGAGYVVVGGVHLLGSEALGDATNNVAEYRAVRNALRAAADAGATSAHVRMDSPVVFGHLSGASRARAEHLIQLKEEVDAQVARYPGRVTFARIPRSGTELPTSSRRTAPGPRRRWAPIGGDRYRVKCMAVGAWVERSEEVSDSPQPWPPAGREAPPSGRAQPWLEGSNVPRCLPPQKALGNRVFLLPQGSRSERVGVTSETGSPARVRP